MRPRSSAVFLSRASLQTAQGREEVTSHRSEFSLASPRVASPRVESPQPCNRSWHLEADRDLHDLLANLNSYIDFDFFQI
jgi:hypothetical protein